MSLPASGQVTAGTAGVFLAPRDIVKELREDWSLGGGGINDSSQGLEVHQWRFFCEEESSDIYVGVPGVVPPSLLYTAPTAVAEIAGSFDTNMQPVVAWQDVDGGAWFRFFDPTVPSYTDTQLDEGSYDVRVALDDTRAVPATIGDTDTLITYVRSGSLYYRQLRDRFAVEYELAAGIGGARISRFGMAEFGGARRMQWEFSYLQLSTVGFEDSRFPTPFIHPKIDLKEKVFGKKSRFTPKVPAGRPLIIPKSRTRP